MAKAKFDRSKPAILVAASFLIASPAFCGSSRLDFDGVAPAKIIISDVISEQAGFRAPLLSQAAEVGLRSRFFRVTESGEEVEVFPYTESDGKDYYEFKPNDYFYHAVSCGAQSGTWDLCADYKFYPGYGGHNHTEGVPPYTLNGTPIAPHRCWQGIPVPNTVRLQYRATEFATRAEHKIQGWGACAGELYNTIDFKIDGLALLPPAWQDGLHGGVTYYTLIGTTAHHPINHFGKFSTITSLQQIAWNYYLEFSTYSAFSRLEVNDMSLRWGGLFDIGGDWRPPHSEHRYGRQADLRRIIWDSSGQMVFMPENQEKKLIKEACKFGVQVLRESKDGRLTDPLLTQDWGSASTAPHFHLRFPLTGDDVENPPDVTPNLANCQKLLNEDGR